MKLFKKYFTSWWLPASLALVLAFLMWLPALLSIIFRTQLASPLAKFTDGTFYDLMLGISYVGILLATIVNFFRRRWRNGIINLLLFFALLLPLAYITLMKSPFGRGSGDGFADDLTIPANIEVTETNTIKWEEISPEEEGKLKTNKDKLQQAILTSLEKAGSEDASIVADISSLVQAYGQNPKMVLRYLAANPAWRLFQEDGELLASRRWMVGNEWSSQDGYFNSTDIDPFSEQNKTMRFETDVALNLSGKISPLEEGKSLLKAGEKKALLLPYNGQRQSYAIIQADNMSVKIMEHSDTKERRVTKAVLAHLQSEFQPLIGARNWAEVKKLLPENSIKFGEPKLEIWGGLGTYEAKIWVNPAEAGRVYLKAFEVTKGTQLSAGELIANSSEAIGWSDNPNELFFAGSNFMISEGDWGKPYAARFEVWFIPDAGTPQRKLLERVFKIEGWQR